MKRLALGLVALLLAVATAHAQHAPTSVFTTYNGETTIQKDNLPPLSTKRSMRLELVRTAADGTVQLVLKNYRLPSPRVELAPITLKGLALESVGEGRWQVVQRSAQEGGFPSADKKLEAYLTIRLADDAEKCYVTDDGRLVLELRILFGETQFTHQYEGKRAITSGIDRVADAADGVAAVYYDLQGRRVERPGRGIYVVGGRKVVR